MKSILSRMLFLFSLGYATPVAAYAPSFLVEHRNYLSFAENRFVYASMFRQGRDLLHSVDLIYSQTNYLLAHERGRAESIGLGYRLVYRGRWGRYFKPSLFTRLETQYRTFSRRDNARPDRLPPRSVVHFNGALGAGYFWEIRKFILGGSVSYGYDFGYGLDFISADLFFAYEI